MTQNSQEAQYRSELYELDQVVAEFEGGLNYVAVVRAELLGQSAAKLAIRRPKGHKERSVTEMEIEEEYRNVGALNQGVGFRLRTPQEQMDFMNSSTSFGLKTLECRMLVGNEMVTEFVEGTPLDQYVQQDPDPAVVNNVLTHLTQAHSVDVVFGDRWGPNTLVKPDGDHVELDFDVELLGGSTKIKTFELAQMLYHMVHFARHNRTDIVNVLANTYTKQPQLLAAYDQTQMNHFINGYTGHFYDQYHKNGSMYVGIVPPNEEIVKLTDSLNSAWAYAPVGEVTNSHPNPTVD